MRIATYNVNGVNGRLPRLLEWLEATRPDVVCLQEIKTSDLTCPVEAITAAGYRALWHGQRMHHGVAILARSASLREVRRGLPGDEEDRQPRYLEAQVADVPGDVPGDAADAHASALASAITVASIYLPNGNPQPGPKFDYKLAWFERLIAHARTLWESGQSVVLAGDFNVVPTDFDIYNAAAWRFDAVMQPQSRDAWFRLLAQGWSDATRQLYPRDRVFTFWVTPRAFERNAGIRLDFLLLSPDLSARLAATGIDAEFRGRDRASDHVPVWVEIR